MKHHHYSPGRISTDARQPASLTSRPAKPSPTSRGGDGRDTHTAALIEGASYFQHASRVRLQGRRLYHFQARLGLTGQGVTQAHAGPKQCRMTWTRTAGAQLSCHLPGQPVLGLAGIATRHTCGAITETLSELEL
jgi:hypothetical protein